MNRFRFGWVVALMAALVGFALPGCNGKTPSARLEERVQLPVPVTPPLPTASTDDASEEMPGELVKLTARTLIPLAFHRQPDIKAGYQAFKTEEARYDFFYTSNDALTPRFRTSNKLERSRTSDEFGERFGEREREHTVEIGVDKQFFDTTEMGIVAGYETETFDGDFGNQPFVSAQLRYPLWESREKLERTSEDIFRRNELNDAQLRYIKQVRSWLEDALINFHVVVRLRALVASGERWRDDLQALLGRLDEIDGRDVSIDRSRIEAELALVNSEVRNTAGRYEVDLARLKYSCGLPYDTKVEIDEEPFNPFADVTHEELRQASIATDPEIATLQNAMRNAEAQLDLARRGKWDVVLLLEGRGEMRGRGAETGNTDWSVSAGLDVSAIDARVTGSLQRQARASIARFKHAIAARESLIYADTLEPLVRIETLGASRDELAANLQKFEEDYRVGVEEYVAGKLNIDDLLKRRETIYEQEEDIGRLGFLVGTNIAELCAATGKFFELLNGPPQDS